MKEIDNKQEKVRGFVSTPVKTQRAMLNVTVTNDKIGKTISIDDGYIQFTIPFEPIEKYLK